MNVVEPCNLHLGHDAAHGQYRYCAASDQVTAPSQIGLTVAEGQLLVVLLEHYPHIVYTAFSLWRRLLVRMEEDLNMLAPSTNTKRGIEISPPPFLQEAATSRLAGLHAAGKKAIWERYSPQQLGITGRLDWVHTTLTNLPRFFNKPWRPVDRSRMPPEKFSDFLKGALLCKQLDVLKCLVVDMELDMSEPWVEGSGTLMDYSVSHCQAEVVSLLLRHGAPADGDPDQLRMGFLSPIHLAARWGRAATIDVLLAAVADPDLTRGGGERKKKKYVNLAEENGGGSTPLHYSAQFGHPEAVATLLRRGAVAETADFMGVTPLHKAACGSTVSGSSHEKSLETVRVLVSHLRFANPAAIYKTALSDKTALHMAASYAEPEIVSLILGSRSSGSNSKSSPEYRVATEKARMVVLADQQGKTSLEYAVTPRNDANLSEETLFQRSREVIRILFDQQGVSKIITSDEKDRYVELAKRRWHEKGEDIAQMFCSLGADDEI